MLYRFHVVLISSGILFSAGLSLYKFFDLWRDGKAASLALALFFLAGSAALSLYLRNLLRH
ncbi:MAG TPA: hypothetical protein VMT52_04055, partial [Planctomycetota bacterium]|nr:hypothetical protein [Planctomycetota bacterium]